MLFHTMVYLWILFLAMVGGMSRPNIPTLLVRGFVVLLWVGTGGIGIGVGLDSSIRIGAEIIGNNFALFHRISFWD